MKRLLLLATALAMGQFANTGASAQNAQGWTDADRSAFYSTDQGSRMIPLKWMMALKQPGTAAPFMADGLGRYGYLKNDATPGSAFPIGFTTNADANGNQFLGMTCAACHTREIQVNGVPVRIDGGPAIVEFQSLMADLDTAVGGVLADNGAFSEFAASVLGGTPNQTQIDALKVDVNDWFASYDAIVQCALPQQANPKMKCVTPPASQAWGPSRLDAVGMISDRLAGLDVGPASNHHVMLKNIRRADAPTRYPFLWNASRQDRTQWPGFAPNGTTAFAMVRNVGEVVGVFGRFYPTKTMWGGADYDDNSIDTTGLLQLETLIAKLSPPPFKWGYDKALAAKGAEIYKWTVEQGAGCEGCHGIKSADPMLPAALWKTPIDNVGTDTREWATLGWKVDPGVLTGTRLGPLPALKPVEAATTVLGNAVGGIILSHIKEIAFYDLDNTHRFSGADGLLKTISSIYGEVEQLIVPASPGSYESRVMQGIWAAAPYLHNGSVPTLDDLLKPATERPTSFRIGPNYDPTGKVGLAATQTKFNFTLQTGCVPKNDPRYKAVLNSGNSNCGHEFGATLKPDEKAALLEYLKSL